jgi:hypothetical protein
MNDRIPDIALANSSPQNPVVLERTANSQIVG